ncbi:nucleoside-diphosphate kinase [Plantactinospora sp. S1510]|uniref:Nucleoside diphosphate kinase n=1 Tax=Plantactinospora alkalitolerans TaxID=2789879 RepID=A0ABS0H1N9_9ACTN|nr:nucleoside-diphosphate kinase [Plantactinospora alkalitolerans]MBF9132377.1 nucleoside-diphosphate kinase [Plantactinospora alkalitolerans]
MISSGSVERTLVLVKPDGVRRRLVSEILGRFERKGLGIDAMVLRRMDDRLADQHYTEHLAEPFYPGLRAFMTSGPLIALVLSGDGVVRMVREMVGATDGRRAAPGTIRGDFATSGRENLVHASDSAENARREIAIWFPDLD